MHFWKTKTFNSQQAQTDWINQHNHTHQITIIYINNGYAVEYRKLRKVY